jgi:hypothetical protein
MSTISHTFDFFAKSLSIPSNIHKVSCFHLTFQDVSKKPYVLVVWMISEIGYPTCSARRTISRLRSRGNS